VCLNAPYWPAASYPISIYLSIYIYIYIDRSIYLSLSIYLCIYQSLSLSLSLSLSIYIAPYWSAASSPSFWSAGRTIHSAESRAVPGPPPVYVYIGLYLYIHIYLYTYILIYWYIYISPYWSVAWSPSCCRSRSEGSWAARGLPPGLRPWAHTYKYINKYI